jgi:hypothetical protein
LISSSFHFSVEWGEISEGFARESRAEKMVDATIVAIQFPEDERLVAAPGMLLD